MVSFWFFCRWVRIPWASTRAIVKVKVGSMSPAVGQGTIRVGQSYLFFVALRRRLLDLSIIQVRLVPTLSLALHGASCIEWPGLTVCAQVIVLVENLLGRHGAILVDVIAFRVLPSVAGFTVHCIPIIVFKATDALYSVIFRFIASFVVGCLKRCSFVERLSDRRRSVRSVRGGICHTMALSLGMDEWRRKKRS